MSCPDDLLDRDDLSPEERARLAGHAAECAVCALEVRLPVAVERRARSVDYRRVSDAAAAAIAKYRVPARRRSRTLFYAGLAAAAALVTATAAAAIQNARVHAMSPTPVMQAAPAMTAPTMTATTVEPMVAAEPTVSVEDLPRSAPRAGAATVRAQVETAARDVATETAAEGFARANRSRQSGDFASAIAQYRTLEREHPSSNEAMVAHVSLGRLLLDHTDDARGASDEYDRYLEAGSHAPLREEALVGRARASHKLGRREEERRYWQSLIAEYPESLSTPGARERVETLR
jgi:TolA-binding protein